jgi:hypothetical protein
VTEGRTQPEVLDTYFQRVTERQNASRFAHRRTLFSIYHNANGMKLSWVSLKKDRGAKVVSWRDVIKVEAFKRDLYAVDLICLKFLFEDNTTLEVDEEMEGWDSLVASLSDCLPGSKKFADWFEVVAFPAFKRNLTVVYRRDELLQNPRQSAVLKIL